MDEKDVLIEPVAGTGRYVIKGPYEPDYGRLHLGWVEKVGRRFEAVGSDHRAPEGRNRIDAFPTRAAAVKALADWADGNITAAALREEFEPRTAGGLRIDFLRRAGGSIVATVDDPRGGLRRVLTSWKEDGSCTVYDRDMGGIYADGKIADAVRLVRRPRPAEDATPVAPAP